MDATSAISSLYGELKELQREHYEGLARCLHRYLQRSFPEERARQCFADLQSSPNGAWPEWHAAVPPRSFDQGNASKPHPPRSPPLELVPSPRDEVVKLDDKKGSASEEGLRCPAGHALQRFLTPVGDWRCNVCDRLQPKSALMHGCEQCNYDVCSACHSSRMAEDGIRQGNIPGILLTEPAGVVPTEPVRDTPAVEIAAEVASPAGNSMRGRHPGKVTQNQTTKPVSLELPGQETFQNSSPGGEERHSYLNANETMGEKTRKRMHMRKSNFLTKRKQEQISEDHSCLQKLTGSKVWEVTSGMAIATNCVFITWQTNWRAQQGLNSVVTGVEVSEAEDQQQVLIQGVFTVVFAFELVVRWMADGWFFVSISTKDFGWNILDILVVCLDLVSFFLELFMQAFPADFTILRALRVLRVVRVAKIIRVMKFFKELRMMMYSVFSCIRSLLWVALLLLMFLGMFAILFTSSVSSNVVGLEMRLDPKTEKLQMYFGDLGRSWLSLYMAMSGGNDWTVYYEALAPLPPYYQIAFLVFITFAIFALANIVTGLFVENAKQSSKQDREDVIQDELVQKAHYLGNMEQIFEEMDTDGTGTISLPEFRLVLKDERVGAYFNALKLDVSDAEHLFNLLDHDVSGQVSYREFVEGCWKLQGEARSLDLKIMALELSHVKLSLQQVRQHTGLKELSDRPHKPGDMRRSLPHEVIRPSSRDAALNSVVR
eukprot:TRINITY_DN29388_c0_g1_i1.p1 TRINITY_DN29388_c0_g1~~TRINITY_DN29388_c0_g1_i1.p1  ORF type:complete len:730 (+),score=113.83 TRINITY_DN29388_c0_g1_i1:47-2191(+)